MSIRVMLAAALTLAACSPVEPRDAGIDRRSPRPDTGAEDVADELEPVVFDVQPIDARDVGDVFDASAPMDALDATRDTGVDARETGPDARDAGVDAPDVVCPPDGFGGYQWEPCANTICCPRGGCRIDIAGRPYCQS